MSPIAMLGKLDWRDWLYTLLKSFISGGASAVTAGFSASAVLPNQVNLGVGLGNFLKISIATFIVSGLLAAFAFLQHSPLPTEEKP